MNATLPQDLYLDLLKKVLIDYHRSGQDEYKPVRRNDSSWKAKFLYQLQKLLHKEAVVVCRRRRIEEVNRATGRDWPVYGESMIGLKRLENIEACIRQVVAEGIPGDLIETGVWRGGATIFMKAVLKTLGVTDRTVWVADSFEGLPKPNATRYAADAGDTHHTHPELAVSLEEVRSNFEKYTLLDRNVQFLKGWFKDTLPTAPIDRLALLRLDGDMYESTMDGLVNLYPKVSAGGFVIVDDWGVVPACREAVNDYRHQHGITEEIIPIDASAVYWRKEK